MKIGFVLDDGLNKPDGVQQYILTLGSWYRQNGHEVRYLVGQTTRTDIEGVYSLARNVKVRFNGNRLSIPLPASSSKIKHVLDKEKFDVLHVQTPYSPLFGAKVVYLADSKTVVVGTFHILPFNILTQFGTPLLGFCLRRSLKRFDYFVGVSAPAVEFAKKSFRINCKVVPNSVLIDQFRPAKSDLQRQYNDSINLLFLGRLVPRKGCQQLLKALVILQNSNSLPERLQINICGDGPMRQELTKYAKHHNLQDKITFHGFVSQQQKVDFMQQADIAVFPSLSGESFGIVLIEAMAAGSGVVLGGNNPGYQSVLEDLPTSIVDAHQPKVFAEELISLINQPEKRRQLHELQQQHVQQFDTTIVAKQLLDIYQSCKKSRIS